MSEAASVGAVVSGDPPGEPQPQALQAAATTPEPVRPRVSPVGVSNLSGISWDGEALWVTVDVEGLLHRVDPDTGEILRTFELPVRDTGGSAWDGEALWQLAYAEKTLYRIDPQSGEVLSTLPAPGDGICAGVTFDGSRLWLGGVEDERLYAIDPQTGELVESRPMDFETTGLAWDGRYLWNGVLVGTETHDEDTPFTGFVQQRDLDTGETLDVHPVQGVFAGGTDWLPPTADSTARSATRMWWYDGHHGRLMEIALANSASANEPVRGVSATERGTERGSSAPLWWTLAFLTNVSALGFSALSFSALGWSGYAK